VCRGRLSWDGVVLSHAEPHTTVMTHARVRDAGIGGEVSIGGG